MRNDQKIILAVPTGRISKELNPIIGEIGLKIERRFFENDECSRFSTNIENFEIIRVKPSDVPTFLSHGGAHIGITGSDAIFEHKLSCRNNRRIDDLDSLDTDNTVSVLNIGIGRCRLAVAKLVDSPEIDYSRASTIIVATKYPNITQWYFNKIGISPQCILLSGAVELGASLGISQLIVDIVSSGRSLRENNLCETKPIFDVTSQLVLNREAARKEPEIYNWVEKITEAARLAPTTLQAAIPLTWRRESDFSL